eukprot:COSAG06_NODE_3053_length_5914_cov_126.204643_3_plen_102_part_01
MQEGRLGGDAFLTVSPASPAYPSDAAPRLRRAGRVAYTPCRSALRPPLALSNRRLSQQREYPATCTAHGLGQSSEASIEIGIARSSVSVSASAQGSGIFRHL